MKYYEIPASEYITCDYWEQLAQELGPPLKFLHTEHAGPFINEVPAGNHILLTAWSDVGIEDQVEKHPNKDILRTALTADWSGVEQCRNKYLNVQLRAPASDQCSPTDRYIAKMERNAYWTFNEVPKNIRWFSANLNVYHPKISFLPFGIIAERDCNQKELEKTGKPTELLHRIAQLSTHRAGRKPGTLYVNFQPHTLERMKLRDHYWRKPWATVRENVPIDQFLEEVASHQFVLCAPGNGMDCYRTLEALYLGARPIFPVCHMADHYMKLGLPVYSTDLFNITPELLRNYYYSKKGPINENNETQGHAPVSYEKLTKSYWKRMFEQLVKLS